MDKLEFLQNLQIAQLAREQPQLKWLHDYVLKQCLDHAEDLMKKADVAKLMPETNEGGLKRR